ncbi:hypothetical protein [Hoylesella loescheii]|uniref:Uncharacterized protein n=1 Tax=Hoylesella loescheii DSM 19665 = JCM 12249 = ATCC 15930 TaxID=1122985 RepID=A0A069QMR0_HOYLO|nr:hypothetical protein [Hoylesella loescheii]KDR53294.1 hypothetical protein HMPREF1991_00658 [Hoylesella loescheii DSM 19665 = JCM 12249 = ATCC 15930]
MTKTFTLKRVGLTLAAFLLTLVASAQTVVFDFNSEKWVNDANGHTMELPEGAELEVDGVKMVNHKVFFKKVTNKLKNQHLFVPRGNSFDFIAPDGKQITKVVFEAEEGYFEISADGDKVLPMVNNNENTRMWEGNAPKITFFGLNTPHIRKATVTLVPNGTTAINEVMQQRAAVYSVFNLNGVKVGTTADFNRLPAGVYVVNGKKMVK